ncbi:MAG: integration host factor subunit beta [Planctomycetes bacterium]|nr:integration host factor subunit beta [Planctomycetota bacterium]
MATKEDLIDRIAESTGTRQKLVKAVVREFFAQITSELAKGNRLELRNFGVFDTKTTPARMAQNPRTLKKVEVPAKRRAVFKPGRLMREGSNGSGQQTQGYPHGNSKIKEPDATSHGLQRSTQARQVIGLRQDGSAPPALDGDNLRSRFLPQSCRR